MLSLNERTTSKACELLKTLYTEKSHAGSEIAWSREGATLALQMAGDPVAEVLSRFESAVGADRSELLCELIIEDMRQSWRCGRGRRLESYLHCWKELNADKVRVRRLVAAMVSICTSYSETAERSDYQRRFPEVVFSESEFGSLVAQGMKDRLDDSYQHTGRFFLLRVIGEGGMGIVYEAYDRHRRQRVALKLLPTITRSSLQLFKREFRILADLAHPRLIELHELFCESDHWFFTMDLIEGTVLSKFLISYSRFSERSRLHSTKEIEECDSQSVSSIEDEFREGDSSVSQSQPPLSTPSVDYEQLRFQFGQLAEGLVALHQAGILHRDLKPSNVLVRSDGNLVIVDFGLAAAFTRVVDWHTVGTAVYMSPEQARGEPLTEASDWYAFGVMLCEALTGRWLFHGSRLAALIAKREHYEVPQVEFRNDVPEDLSRLAMKLLAGSPIDRPSWREVITVLGTTGSGDCEVNENFSIKDRTAIPFVGRADVIEILATAMERVLGGTATVVHLCGNSGSGKSRLVDQFIRQGNVPPDANVLLGRCYEGESVPFKAIDVLIDELCRRLSAMPVSDVEAMIPRQIGELARIFPAMKHLDLPSVLTAPVASSSDAQERRQIAFSALRELLRSLAIRVPLVLVVDDFQWGDVDSANVLADLMRQPDPPNLLLIVVYRDEFAENNPCLKSLRSVGDRSSQKSISIGPLSENDALDLARQLISPEHPERTRVAQAIAHESQGIPYFIHELAEHIVRDPQSSVCDFDEVLKRRVERLPEESSRLLQVISVAAQPIRAQVAMETAGHSIEQAAAMSILRARRLLLSTGRGVDDTVCTYHDRIRESVVKQIDAVQLKGFHLRLAHCFQHHHDVDPERIGFHFESAELNEQAGAYYCDAADLAAEKLAFDRAARLYRSSLELQKLTVPEIRRRRIRLADALANAGRGYEAAREYQGAIDPEVEGDLLSMQRNAAYQYCISGHIAEGRSSLEKVLQQTGLRLSPSPGRALLSMLSQQVFLRLRGLRYRTGNDSVFASPELTKIDIVWAASAGLSMFDVVEGAAFQTRNLRLSLRVGEPKRLVRALAWEAAHASNIGGRTWNRVQHLLGLAREVAKQTEDPYAHAMIFLSEGVANWTNGRWKVSLELLNQAETRLRQECANVAWELDTCQTFILWALFYLGRFEELSHRANALLVQSKQRGDLYAETTHGTFGVPMALLAADRPIAARESVEESLAKWTHPAFHVQHSIALMAETYIDLYCHRGEEAWVRYQDQWNLLAKSKLLFLQTVRMFNLHLRSRAALAMIEQSLPSRGAISISKVKRLVARDARTILRSRMPYCIPHAHHLQAGLAFINGDIEKAINGLTQTARGYDSVDMPIFASSIRMRLGQWLGNDEGDQMIRESITAMQSMGIVNPKSMCDALVVGCSEKH